MKTKLLLVIVSFMCLLNLNPANAQTDITAHTVSGVWDISGSPYIVKTNLLVDAENKLTINPGVTVKFETDAKLNIDRNGAIYAIGKPDSMIRFTSNSKEPESGDWKGIVVEGSEESEIKSEFKHCIIEYAWTGLCFDAYAIGCASYDNYSEIDSSIIRRNYTGISFEGGASDLFGCTNPKTGECYAKITNSRIHDNKLFGIACRVDTGYFAHGFVNPLIKKNLIFNNSSGIECWGGNDENEPIIINNTIAFNTLNGIRFSQLKFDPVDLKIINNIISDNIIGINNESDSILHTSYNIFWNETDFSNQYGGDIIGFKNIFENPQFTNPQEYDFTLLPNSPCIDSGDPV